jgi:hypothetical protein
LTLVAQDGEAKEVDLLGGVKNCLNRIAEAVFGNGRTPDWGQVATESVTENARQGGILLESCLVDATWNVAANCQIAENKLEIFTDRCPLNARVGMRMVW